LGILNTKKINIALMLKWIWKLYQDDDSIWDRLIHAKYTDTTDIFSCAAKGDHLSGKSYIKSKTSSKLELNTRSKMGAEHNFGMTSGTTREC
jgi:hypothetical protein